MTMRRVQVSHKALSNMILVWTLLLQGLLIPFYRHHDNRILESSTKAFKVAFGWNFTPRGMSDFLFVMFELMVFCGLLAAFTLRREHALRSVRSSPTDIWVRGKLVKDMPAAKFTYLEKDIKKGTVVYHLRVRSHQIPTPGGISIWFKKQRGQSFGVPSDFVEWEEEI